jgi:hypothetical protein
VKLWLDAHAYGRSLLRQGREPWDDPASIGPFAGELCQLLGPWRLAVPLAPLLLAGIDAAEDSDARAEAFDARARSGDVRAALALATQALAHSPAAGHHVPLLPGPSLIAPGLTDEDLRDDLVAALGEVVRAIGASAADGVLLVDEPDAAVRDDLTPLRRVAEHGGARLLIVGEGLPRIGWDGLGADMPGEALATVPAGANPEAVLELLGRLGG